VLVTERLADLRSTKRLDEVTSVIQWNDSHPVTAVRVEELVLDGSPRQSGEDPEHIRLLAELTDLLPPITVHRPTMRVIDGVHRVKAALFRGRSEIRARLLDCDENAAFVLAVKANVTHGLPLSHSDRAAAAARIIAQQPHWSDRAVAAATGLSDKTVSRIRGRSRSETPQSNTRLGRDGRVRPLDSCAKRRQAAAMIHDKPDAGLREVARATGLSAATVRDVRQRIARGEDPVPGRYRHADRATRAAPTVSRQTAHSARSAQRAYLSVDVNMLLEKLRQDPSVRFSEAGRLALRWLHQHTIDAADLDDLMVGLPDHWAPVVASLAHSCAMEWARLAEQLERRTA
jgi:ParB-like chromosome segregation protein Spo0J